MVSAKAAATFSGLLALAENAVNTVRDHFRRACRSVAKTGTPHAMYSNSLSGDENRDR